MQSYIGKISNTPSQVIEAPIEGNKFKNKVFKTKNSNNPRCGK